MDIVRLMFLSRQMKNRRHEKDNMVTGIPPLTFIANKTGLLKNYRIYGNTVNGNSVGDRTANLFDGNFLQGYWAYADGEFIYVNRWICTTKISCTGGQAYTYSFPKVSRWSGFVWYDGDGNYISTNNRQDGSNTQYRLYSATAPSNAAFMVVNIAGYPFTDSVILPSNITDFMLVAGEYTSETMPNYEPYGYRVPVTVTNGTDTETTNIYLPEQIKMVGDEAEYIDYGEQKQHRVRKNLWSGVVEQGAVSQLGDYISNTKRIRSKNVPLEPGTYAISSNLLLRVIYAFNDTQKIGLCASIYKGSYSYTITVPAGANNISIGMMKVVDGVEVDITPSDFEWGQVEKGSEVTNYEPYITNTELDVTLPALPVLPGTNTLTVGTEIQPSRVELTGRIKEGES